MGGGNDVDEAFRWMCELNNGGDFLVIRATGTDAYNPYIQRLCRNSGRPANSVATLIIPSRQAANLQDVKTILSNAEAVFIAGGDQSDYINFWTGTEVQSALNKSVQKGGVPIGGTSAGLNVLTEFVYSALGPTGITSAEALANPYSDLLTLSRNFVSGGALEYFQGIIGDPHFVQRDRMGRDLAFLCRINLDFGIGRPRAISVDSATALLIDEHGTARLVGTGTAYFLQPTSEQEQCTADPQLTYRFVGVQKIGKGGIFDIPTWSSTANSTFYTVSANAGVLSSSQKNGKLY
jgi:cyanophycinase